VLPTEAVARPSYDDLVWCLERIKEASTSYDTAFELSSKILDQVAVRRRYEAQQQAAAHPEAVAELVKALQRVGVEGRAMGDLTDRDGNAEMSTSPTLPNVQATAPERIYLVIGDDVEPDTDFAELDRLGGVSWCADKIDDNSIEYVRADLASLPAVQGEQPRTLKDWFLSLPEGRQAVLRDDKWMLADAAFQAGLKASQDARTSSVAAGRLPSAQPNAKDGLVDPVVPTPEPPGATLSPGAASQWQPIDTAPMDGTEFLGYRRGQMATAYRVPRDDCEMWSFGDQSAAHEYWPDMRPTHWMPLPEPPQVEQGESNG
jgi:hypothetical protein